MYFISNYIHIENGFIFENGKEFFSLQNASFSDFIKEAYKTFDGNYPKFYKMDDLCKLAYMASELLLKNETEKDVALLFSNNEGSLETDIKHQQSIQNSATYFPSPAVFVYTLPNIAIGEVSIKHQLKSESCFFIAETFPTAYMHTYAEYLLKANKAKKVLCGWVHYLNGTYKAHFYIVGLAGNLDHNTNNIKNITK